MQFNFEEIAKNEDVIDIDLYQYYEKQKQQKKQKQKKDKILDMLNYGMDASLDNYFIRKDNEAKKIKKDICYISFCRYLDLYKNNNQLFFDIQNFYHKENIIKNNSKVLKDVFFNSDIKKQVYNTIKKQYFTSLLIKTIKAKINK